MITIDSNAKANPIYIGGLVLSYFNNSEYKVVEVDALYKAVCEEINISFDVFTIALDWLFLCNKLDFDVNRGVKYVS